jgi:hypothetical protein
MAELSELRTGIAAELREAVPAPVAGLAAQLAQRARGGAVAVLYYGSTLRTAALDGLLDFYVLLDRATDWPGSRLAAAANRVLPPNVGYVEGTFDGVPLRAKYAVITMAQFEARVAGRSLDTTLWARFCQPSRCAWQRSAADGERVVSAISTAVVTAAGWAAAHGPAQATADAYWAALFARTYSTEIRVEKGDRSLGIVAADAPRYARLLPLAWQANGIGFQDCGNGQLRPDIDEAARQDLQQRWTRRELWGKPLNMLRLAKAAFTFDGGMDYVAWKVERHSGVRIDVKPWQRRFPLLAAPGLYLKLRRLGVIR